MSVTNQQAKNFIATIAPIVVKVAKERGWGCPSAIIAQACCESAYGSSQLSAKYHNYFGLKCGSKWKGAAVNMKTKEEYTVGTLTSISAYFRAYADMEAGVNGYFDFLSSARYATTRAQKTPREFLTAIKNAGYATSSTYVNTNMNLVNKWNLTQYDGVDSVPVTNTPTATSTERADTKANNSKGKTYDNYYTVGNTYTVKVKLNVRTEPMGNVIKVLNVGAKCTCQGIMWYDGDVWMKTPSGWVCTGKDGKRYVS